MEEGLGGFPIFLRSLPQGMLLLANILSGEEQGETAVFAGYGIAVLT